MAAIRLQKIIAQAGLASRREAERLIAEGRVQVNGERVLTLGAKADPLADSIKVDGKLITKKELPVYLVLNKPKHVLTTMRDEEGKDRPTVADLLPQGLRRVFPVGRLDFDVEGVLLLTNDGEMANRLAHPRYGIPRVYEAKVKGTPTDAALARMADGSWMRGRGRKAQPAQVRIIRGKTEKNAWLRIELREGRQHQVKKMCEAVGHPVIKLVRRAYAGVTARGLPGAKVRTLTRDEVEKLKLMTNIRPEAAKRPPSTTGWAKARTKPKRAAHKGSAKQQTKQAGKSARP
ncbi:MAG: pseudouridine synthase [Nitrospinae bacterium]|nr:pseudouridine synthase [Nitrospinota bacterium]